MASADMTREQHLAWAKARALEYLPDDPHQAFMSLTSDLGKHPGTEGHSGLMLGTILLMGGRLDSAEKMREFILGFN